MIGCWSPGPARLGCSSSPRYAHRGSPTSPQVSLRLSGASEQLFQKVAKAWDLDCVFDSDFKSGSPIRFVLDNVDYREALHGLEAATGTFIVPVTSTMFMVGYPSRKYSSSKSDAA